MSMPETATSAVATPLARAAWMRILALCLTPELETAMRSLGALPTHRWLRKPETGMTMVQGRSGGTGARFNLGEMTITRCALTLSPTASAPAATATATATSASASASASAAAAPPTLANASQTAPTNSSHTASANADKDRIGIAYVQGRSARHAEYAAIADALLQSPTWHDQVSQRVLAPLQSARRVRLAQHAEALAQTRVDFFTMDRGENPDD